MHSLQNRELRYCDPRGIHGCIGLLDVGEVTHVPGTKRKYNIGLENTSLIFGLPHVSAKTSQAQYLTPSFRGQIHHLVASMYLRALYPRRDTAF